MTVPRAVVWPMQSKRRFLWTFAGVVVVVALIGAAAGGHRTAPRKPVGKRAVPAATGFIAPTTPSTTAPPGVSSPSATVPVAPLPVAPTSATAPAGVIEVATRFFVAWARPSLPEPVWLAGVQPLATPDLKAGLVYTDPGSVDPHRMIGVISSVGDHGGGDVDIRGDTGTYVVAVVLEPGRGYRVTDIEPG